MRDVVSAWNWKTGRWDYYRVPSNNLGAYGDVPPPPIGGAAHALGETPEESAHTMPAGAVRVGSGDTPAGQVVRPPGGGGVGVWALVGAVTLLAWWLWRR
jgi:hypothetical protein